MQHGIIGVQIAALKLKQLNLGYINPGFFAVMCFHYSVMICILFPV